MKKKIFNIIKIIIPLIVIIVFFLIIFKSYAKDENKLLISKVEEELNFISNKLIIFSNKLNNISFRNYSVVGFSLNNQDFDEKKDSNENNSQDSSKDSGEVKNDNKNLLKYELIKESILNDNKNTIDWNYLKNDFESIYLMWTSLILDLTSLNVDNNDILKCSDILNDLLISIKEEDKVIVLRNISRLYFFIPKFKEQILENDDKIIVNIEYIKYYLINSCSYLEENNFDEINKSLINALEYMQKVLNDINNQEKEENSSNKYLHSYILLNELINSNTFKDNKVFLLKYKLFMESLI